MYVGESKRPIRLRFNEHVRNMLNASPDTPLGDHFRERHAQLALDRGGDLPLTVELVYQAVDYRESRQSKIIIVICINIFFSLEKLGKQAHREVLKYLENWEIGHCLSAVSVF